MLRPKGPVIVAVYAGGVPLPGRVEVRDLHDGAQVAGAVGVAAEFAVPVLLPVRSLQILGPRSIDAPSILLEPIRLPVAVQASDLRLSQRIWSFRSASRDSGSPSAGRSARWSLTIPARVRRSRSLAVTGAVIRSPYPQYAGCGGECSK